MPCIDCFNLFRKWKQCKNNPEEEDGEVEGMEWTTKKNVLSAHKFKEQIMNCLTGATEIEIGRDGFWNARDRVSGSERV